MHVLITADTVGGVWTYVRELVSGLARRGVRVTLISFGNIPTADQLAWLDGLPEVDFRATAFRLEWMQDCEADLQLSAKYVDQLVSEVKPELLHLNQYYYGRLACDVPRLVVAHSDVVSWWHAVHGHEPPESKWLSWYREIVSRGLSRADAVVAPSRWMLDAITRHYLRPANGFVIHNGRSPFLFNPYVPKDDCLVAVGRLWDCGKQVSLLAEHKMPVKTYIVGSEVHPDAAYRAGLRDEAGRSRVHFKGPQSESQLSLLYARSTMYAATSRYEPFGLAPVEAAFSRCALVANDIPTFRELWADAACYFDTNDGESLRAAVDRLSNDPRLRLEYANRAYHHARRHFTAERMVDSYMNLYQQLAFRHSAAA
jgi:glycogen synthase